MAINPLAIGGIGVAVTAAAVTGGLYAGGIIGGGNNAPTSSSSQSSESGQPKALTEPSKWHTLLQDSDYKGASNPYQGKYGEKYSAVLVGVTSMTNTNGNDETNDDWWEWSYNTRIKGKEAELKGKFSKVNSGKDGTTSLKNICGEAYKVENTNSGNIITDDSTSVDETKFRESDIWKYCTSGGTKLKSIKDATTAGASASDNTKYGKKYEDKLVSDTDNNWFWDLKQKELEEAGDLTNTSSEFKKLKEPSSTKKVREVCKEAYAQTAQEDSADATAQYPKKEVFRFCALAEAPAAAG